MAINTEFYQTLNELTETYRTGKMAAGDDYKYIVDYDSFVDVGKQLGDLDPADLANGFLSSLMNKVSLVIDTFRSYEPSLADMYKGDTNGGTIELLTHAFYAVRQAPFIGMTDTDHDAMIAYKKPAVDARYYTDEVAWQGLVSITDTELRAAWKSPEAMESFIQSILGAVSNSNKLRREVLRVNAINSQINDVLTNATRITNVDKPGQFIDLIAVYDDFKGSASGLTATTALADPEFVRFAVTYINQFREWLTKPSEYYNHSAGQGSDAVVTFTPKSAQRLKISGIFKTAMGRSLVGAYNPQFATLEGPYETIPYWQGAGKAIETSAVGDYDPSNIGAGQVRLTDTHGLVAHGDTANVAAVLYDDYALGEFMHLNSVTSERNNMKLYTTYFYNYIMKYIRNENANFVVFTLGEIQKDAQE